MDHNAGKNKTARKFRYAWHASKSRHGNSVVFLMGLLSAEEADRVAREAAEVNDAERVVKLFEIISGPATSPPSS